MNDFNKVSQPNQLLNSRHYNPANDPAVQAQLNEDFQMMQEHYDQEYAAKLIELRSILV